MQQRQPLIIAHRGVHVNRDDENTLTAFQKAIDVHMDGLEVDVQLHNQELILKHDIAQDIAPDTATFPMFLDLVRQTNYQGLLLIELKGTEGAALLYEQLMMAHLTNPIILQSFRTRPLKVWRQLDAKIAIGYLRHWPNLKAWRLRWQGIIQYVNLDYRFWFLGWLRPWGTKTFWWTPNNKPTLAAMRRLPLAAIITDAAIKMKRKRKRNG